MEDFSGLRRPDLSKSQPERKKQHGTGEAEGS
jgi:hypothetical protein